MKEKKAPETYAECAAAAGLGGILKDRYLAYMTIRWPGSEYCKSVCGYAGEWAERFKYGMEYSASDLEGLRVLKTIDKERSAT